MSSVLSEQSCVREGAGFDEVYLLGQDNLNTSFDEHQLTFHGGR